MPEGPSIVILKEAVEPFAGKKVICASTDKGLDISGIEGQTIIDFKSYGKNFFICFKNFSIRIHLMMFGSYTVNERKDRPARLGLHFAEGEINFYTCVAELIRQPLDELYDWTADVMNPDFDRYNAIQKLKENAGAMACDVLLDQQIFGGVGNIIKNEVLFRTRIHPQSIIGKTPDTRLKEMVDEAVNYSFEFLKWKKEFTLKKHWQAYKKKICPRDNVAFKKAGLGKTHRSCFYCDVCMIKYI